ncbi:MAG: VanZ family protein [Verrucomicrobiota bacterium]|nr:VanZ family protein [Verrucomicrobiota bacterium]
MSAALFIRYWLPVIIWMSLIFSASTDLGSVRRTSRIIGPFLRWFNPEVSDEAIATVQLLVRKAGHLVGYAILALLVWRAKRNAVPRQQVGWSNADARFALLVTALYACTDELHQAFVPSRLGSPLDVVIDTVGGALGLALVYLLGKTLKRW